MSGPEIEEDRLLDDIDVEKHLNSAIDGNDVRDFCRNS